MLMAKMGGVVCLVILWAAFRERGVSAQIDANQEYENFVLDQVASFDRENDFSWTQTAEFFGVLNADRAAAAAAVSALYAGADAAAVEAAILAPECAAQSDAVYKSNWTEAYAFLCCHARAAGFPQLAATQTAISVLYWGAADPASGHASKGIENIRQSLDIVEAMIRRGFCKADQRIHFRQMQRMVLDSIRIAGGDLASVYDFAEQTAQKAAGCLGAPISGETCAANTQTTLAATPYRSGFAAIDPVYQGICGSTRLGTFENFRVTNAC